MFLRWYWYLHQVQRWEVEFFNDDDETVEIEIFPSDGTNQ